jgi:hypothetical protein
MMPALPATVSEPAQDDAQPPMAAPPPPVPIAASNDDVQATGALEARTDSNAPTPLPPKRAPAPTPVLSLEQSVRLERSAANPTATSEIPISRAAPLAAPAGAPVLRRERQLGKPQPEASRASSSPQAAGNTATQQAPPPRDEDTRGEIHRTASLKLSTPPREWLMGYAASGVTQPPDTIRIMAATPDAVVVQTWVARLRDQLKQRGWPTQIELAQDSNLAADELRLKLSGAAP